MDLQERQRVLQIINRLLRSDDGKILLEELEAVWDGPGILGADPQTTAYNCGKRDAYKMLLELAEDRYSE